MKKKLKTFTKGESLDFMNDDIPVTTDVAFSQLSVQMLKDSVKEQIEVLGKYDDEDIFFQNPGLYNMVNYLEKFDDKYNAVRSAVDNDDIALLQDIDDTRTEFYGFVVNMIKEKFGIEFDFMFSVTEEERFIYIESLYEYFILRIEDTIINYVTNEIIDNYKTIIKSMKSLVNKKDIAFTCIKKELNNTDYATVVYNVEPYVESMEIDTIEGFIENSRSLMEEPMESFQDNVNDLFIDESEGLLGNLYFNTDITEKVMKEILKHSTSTLLAIKTNLMNYFKNL